MTGSLSEVRVRCGACAHEWAAVKLTMEAGRAACKLQRLNCPQCGEGPGNIFMATPGKART